MPLDSATPFEDASRVMARAAAQAMNAAADDLAAKSLDEAPLDVGTLRASCLYPSNDPTGEHSATEDDLDAMVSYNTVYAHAQHEGEALQHWIHPRVPISKHGVVVGFFTDTSRIQEKEVLWVARRYSTPGTKSHFLSDPLKAEAARYQTVIEISIERAFAEHQRRAG
jgi:hypothetical protein